MTTAIWLFLLFVAFTLLITWWSARRSGGASAYFAAGRQPNAEGGILIHAIDPMNGRLHWTHRLDSVPQEGFYENSGLEFDPFDLLYQEVDLIRSFWLGHPESFCVNTIDWYIIFANIHQSTHGNPDLIVRGILMR